MLKVGLFWFTHDLRVDDNAALARAAQEVDRLICLYCVDRPARVGDVRHPNQLSPIRRQFQLESLIDLNQALQQLGQHLEIREQPPLDAIAELITVHNISQLYSSVHVGSYENEVWGTLQKRYGQLSFNRLHSHTLFEPSDLPFAIQALPDSFSKFRRAIEKPALEIPSPLDSPQSLPAPCTVPDNYWQQDISNLSGLFTGGAGAAERHIRDYFNRDLASSYKQTRNGLDGLELFDQVFALAR